MKLRNLALLAGSVIAGKYVYDRHITTQEFTNEQITDQEVIELVKDYMLGNENISLKNIETILKLAKANNNDIDKMMGRVSAVLLDALSDRNVNDKVIKESFDKIQEMRPNLRISKEMQTELTKTFVEKKLIGLFKIVADHDKSLATNDLLTSVKKKISEANKVAAIDVDPIIKILRSYVDVTYSNSATSPQEVIPIKRRIERTPAVQPAFSIPSFNDKPQVFFAKSLDLATRGTYNLAQKIYRNPKTQHALGVMQEKFKVTKAYVTSPEFKADVQNAKQNFANNPGAQKVALAMAAVPTAALLLTGSNKTRLAMATVGAGAAAKYSLKDNDAQNFLSAFVKNRQDSEVKISHKHKEENVVTETVVTPQTTVDPRSATLAALGFSFQ